MKFKWGIKIGGIYMNSTNHCIIVKEYDNSSRMFKTYNGTFIKTKHLNELKFIGDYVDHVE